MADGRALLRARQFFEPRQRSADGWNEVSTYARDWEASYRRRWQHDRVVRSTHGVNCTGSCSWKIHVKDGLVTWETQQTDYPSNGPDVPDYEPRGCPRGASFSWYVYSPLRPKHPYVRGVLLEMYCEARNRLGDPVEAWASIVDDPDRSRAYKATGVVGAAGGLGGFFPPLLLGVVKDATGEFVLAFVFLVAFAWMCAGMAVSLLEPGHVEQQAGVQ